MLVNLKIAFIYIFNIRIWYYINNKNVLRSKNMLILVIVLCSFSLLLSFVILICLNKIKSLQPSKVVNYEQELSELMHKFDSFKEVMKYEIQNNMQKEIIKFKNDFLIENNSQRSSMAEFERTVNRQIIESFNKLNEILVQRINDINERVNKSIQGGFDDTTKAYQSLSKQLQIIDQARTNIQNLSTEVVSLRNVLENNQNRGKFGEFTLERILFSVFGDAKKGIYDFQYALKDGMEINDRPDAVVFLPEPNHLICIDSKFPFQNYQSIIESQTQEEREQAKKGFASAVKKHITDVKNKYIIKGKTASQALLFIPSDALFGFIHGELENVVQYARESNVILTSPSTLQPILATMNMVRVQYERNKNVQTITQSLDKLSKEFGKFAEDWRKFSDGVNQLYTRKDNFEQRVSRIQTQFTRIESNAEIESFELEEHVKVE